MIRFEILLPLFYNDGRPIEKEKFRVRIDVDDTPENTQEMRQMKEILKTKFEQVDIWISAHRIDIL